MGWRALASFEQVPEPVDLAILGVGNGALENDAAQPRAGWCTSAVICARATPPRASRERPCPSACKAIAHEYGMAVCGGNGMGFINLERRVARHRVQPGSGPAAGAGDVPHAVRIVLFRTAPQQPRHPLQPRGLRWGRTRHDHGRILEYALSSRARV